MNSKVISEKEHPLLKRKELILLCFLTYKFTCSVGNLPVVFLILYAAIIEEPACTKLPVLAIVQVGPNNALYCAQPFKITKITTMDEIDITERSEEKSQGNGQEQSQENG